MVMRHLRVVLSVIGLSLCVLSAVDRKLVVPEYIRLLDHSFMFYEAQRSGVLPANNRVAWRHDSALQDGSDVHVDLTGGYYDAGDYIKHAFPLCYTLFTLSWGGIDYFSGYRQADQLENLRAQIKWIKGTDWLIKAHPSPDTLFIQVGDPLVDNNYWGPDSTIPQPRPSYQINASAFGTDVAASAAAAFSAASLFFQTLSTETNSAQDEEYAALLLQHATQIYDASVRIKPFILYQDSVPAGAYIYSSSDYEDELILASLWMYRATRQPAYFDQAQAFYDASDVGGRTPLPTDWDDKYGAINVMFAQLGTEMGVDAERHRAIAEQYFDDFLSGLTAKRTKGGMFWWDAASPENSLISALSTSNLLLLYTDTVLRPLATQSDSNPTPWTAKMEGYTNVALSQLDYAFGKNPLQQNYIVGERPNSPKHPHHAGASGDTSLSQIDNSTHAGAQILYGALVGGPDKNDMFRDEQSDWRHSEVALDYNAAYQNLLARQVMYSDVDPFYMPRVTEPHAPTSTRPTPHLGPSPRPGSSLATWALALSIVLPLTFVLGLALVMMWWIRGRQKLPPVGHMEKPPIDTLAPPPKATLANE